MAPDRAQQGPVIPQAMVSSRLSAPTPTIRSMKDAIAGDEGVHFLQHLAGFRERLLDLQVEAGGQIRLSPRRAPVGDREPRPVTSSTSSPEESRALIM